MTLPAGTSLGPYLILAPIGAGGMGEVYRARDPRLGREVALKVLPASLAENPDRLRRFEQEARAAGAINHPNILAVYDIGTYDGTPYVVSELLEGESVGKRMAGSPLPLRKALEYAIQVARGLAAAHAKGIVHRDLKPENLFVTSDGRVKILDFGLAKLSRPEPGSGLRQEATLSTPPDTTPGTVLGTVGYMAPEQIRGMPADHRSDIFSFGAILYEMIVGRRAFKGDTSAETMYAILKHDPLEPLGVERIVPPGVEGILRHCVEKSPDERFQSARDLAFHLEAITGASHAAPQVLRQLSGARLLPVSIALGLLGAVALGVALGKRLERPATVAPVSVRRLTDLPGLEESPAISPDGKSVAFTAAVDARRQVFVRLIAGGVPLQITKDAADHRYPRWSPDSSALIYFSPPAAEESEGTIWEISALGGSPRRLARSFSGGDISHDGKRIVFLRFSEGRVELTVANRDGSGARAAARLDPGGRWRLYPRWSPDDQLIAYQEGLGFDFDVFVVPAGGGEPRAIINRGNALNGFTWSADGSGIIFSSAARTTMMYLPIFNLWEVPLRGGGPRQLTFGEASYLNPDLKTPGLVAASRTRMQSDLWKFPIGGSPTANAANAVRITRQTGQVLTPSVSPGDKELVYLSDSGGHGNLWVMKLDSGELRQITFEQDPTIAVGVPVWSPDGRAIAFVLRGTPPSRAGLWLVKPDGSDLRRADPFGGWACWSANGRWLYYNTLPSPVLKKVPAEGGPAITVRSDPATRPALSPDGKTLHYVLELPAMTGGPDFELRTASPENAPSRVLARIPASRAPGGGTPGGYFHPVMSPDGAWLALALTDGVTTNLWAVSTKDGAWRQLTDFRQRATLITRRLSWSSDGRSIYAALAEGDADVVLLGGLR